MAEIFRLALSCMVNTGFFLSNCFTGRWVDQEVGAKYLGTGDSSTPVGEKGVSALELEGAVASLDGDDDDDSDDDEPEEEEEEEDEEEEEESEEDDEGTDDEGMPGNSMSGLSVAVVNIVDSAIVPATIAEE